MSHDDPIRKLEAHYRAQSIAPFPDIRIKAPMRWYEPVGGLAVGIAVVFVAISACRAGVGPANAPGGSLLQRQMHSAGLVPVEPDKPRRAQRMGQWHI